MNRLFGLKSLVTQVLYPPNTPKIGTIWKHYRGDLFVVSSIATSREIIDVTNKGTNEITKKEINKLNVCYYMERDLVPYFWIMPLDRWHQKVEHDDRIVSRCSNVSP